MEPGLYDAVLLVDGEEASRNSFWLVETNATPTLGTDKASYTVGDAITVSWENAHSSVPKY